MKVVTRSSGRKRACFQPSAELVPRILAGSRADIARMISRAESEDDEAAEALATLYRHAGRAHVIGVTGVPGSGKSTLISALTRAYLAEGRKVAVVAVDPTSPFSGGAILGDRIRMSEVVDDGRAFIRSMATRGSLGGLARATLQAVDILDAAGHSPILIETVGVGQDEIEIVHAAHTVVVLSPPGLGDDIQAIKAGVMEIADIHAVSKADKPEAAATVATLKGMMVLGSDVKRSDWELPVLAVSATADAGPAELKQAIDAHGRHLADSGELAARQRAIARRRILTTIGHLVRRRFEENADDLAARLDSVADRTSDPLSAARWLLGASKNGHPNETF